MAVDADPDWEVATVKRSDSDARAGQHIELRGRQVLLLDTTLEQFLLLGYGVQSSQLVGEPDWAKTELWDVDGVPDAPGEPSWPQMQGLIRKILAQRFGLQLHHEQRELSVFALTVAKGGPKMTANTSDPNGRVHQQQKGSNSSVHVEGLTNASMADLATILQFHVDRTGIKGRYDFKLQWALDETPVSSPDAPPGLFTAIQDQIGLKLERQKAPADALLIDKVQRPEAN